MTRLQKLTDSVIDEYQKYLEEAKLAGVTEVLDFEEWLDEDDTPRTLETNKASCPKPVCDRDSRGRFIKAGSKDDNLKASPEDDSLKDKAKAVDHERGPAPRPATIPQEDWDQCRVGDTDTFARVTINGKTYRGEEALKMFGHATEEPDESQDEREQPCLRCVRVPGIAILRRHDPSWDIVNRGMASFWDW